MAKRTLDSTVPQNLLGKTITMLAQGRFEGGRATVVIPGSGKVVVFNAKKYTAIVRHLERAERQLIWDKADWAETTDMTQGRYKGEKLTRDIGALLDTLGRTKTAPANRPKPTPRRPRAAKETTPADCAGDQQAQQG